MSVHATSESEFPTEKEIHSQHESEHAYLSNPRRSKRILEREAQMAIANQNYSEHENSLKSAFISEYDVWKTAIKIHKASLKDHPRDTSFEEINCDIRAKCQSTVEAYDALRKACPPEPEMTRQVDKCVEISKIMMEHITKLSDTSEVPSTLRSLFNPEDVHSVFGSSIAPTSRKSTKKRSERGSIYSSKRMNAIMDLAAREKEMQLLKERDEQQREADEIKEQLRKAQEALKASEFRQKQAEVEAAQLRAQQKEIDAMKEKLLKAQEALNTSEMKQSQAEVEAARLRVQQKATDEMNEKLKKAQEALNASEMKYKQAEIEAARLRVQLLDQDDAESEVSDLDSIYDLVANNAHLENRSAEQTEQFHKPEQSRDESLLIRMMTDALNLSRLPAPEPTVFNGDPLTFTEWKRSFGALIERRCTSASEKMFFLKKYVSGDARRVLEGYFLQISDAAYEEAWKTLLHRYGHPFVIGKAYRDKLQSWPKISSNDSQGLMDFSDFLKACRAAIPFTKGLDSLNNCHENQKILHCLPDWLVKSWNREVHKSMQIDGDFPSFSKFVDFVQSEAEIACNPISSLYALHKSDRDAKSTAAGKEPLSGAATVHATNSASNDPHDQCSFCKESHHLSNCAEFQRKTVEERHEFVKSQRLCFGCLRRGHMSKDCRRRHTCKECHKKHPTCLHDPFYRPMNNESASTSQARSAISHNVSRSIPNSTSTTVPVWISSKLSPEREVLVYALLDTQSDTTFLTDEVFEQLDAISVPSRLKLNTMSSKECIIHTKRVEGLQVRGFNTAEKLDLPSAYTRESIPFSRENIPTCETAKNWKHLHELQDKLPSLQDCEVGLLVGFNCPKALAPLRVILGKDNEPFAQQTVLGWSIVGGTDTGNSSQNMICTTHRVYTKELPALVPTDALRILEADFQDVRNDCDKQVSQDDLYFLHKLEEGIVQKADGHLEMPLPFKQRPRLPDNKKLAAMRLDHLKRKFSKNEKYHAQYKQFMNDIIQKGDAEVASESIKDETWYIPHHGVYHPKKPDKLRVVFDASARCYGESLNDHLLTGPDLTNSLVGVLCRFRQNDIAIMCDIERMFHQFHVQPSDREYLRFLWWEDGNIDTEPQEYHMNVHLFGAASSPGCANYGLKYLANMHKETYPEAAKFLSRNFYVDDGIISVPNEHLAKSLINDARKLCSQGGLRLHKFITNNRSVMSSIPSSEQSAELKNRNLDLEKLPVERTLGMQWCVETDSFHFNVQLKDHATTRRGILSAVASLFDPLGLVAPFVLVGKSILQNLCRQGSCWDDPLPDRLHPAWNQWKADLPNLAALRIDRQFTPKGFKVIKTELHHFSDASSFGYGQCSYLRLMDSDNNVHCSLVMGKSRIAPTKVTTIPRLELTAATISVKISKILKNELEYPDIEEHFWTDSKVTLGYINNEARRFHTFVANRVQLIRNSTSPKQWHYVPSTENPADHASRGLTANELAASNWYTGPTFLWEKTIVYNNESITHLKTGDPEVKEAHVFSSTTTTPKPSIVDKLHHFSNWSSALRGIARLVRVARKEPSSNPASVNEIQNATGVIVKQLQQAYFTKEIKALSSGNPVASNSKLSNLDPFLDGEGILRVGGRLSRSSLPFVVKHATILPKDSHVTQLIIKHYHHKVHHQGRGITINEIRSNGFWIIGCSKAVSSLIQKCTECRRARSTPQQMMADLPEDRVEPSPPFTFCGMDCFGPFLIKNGRKEIKVYGLIITCMSSRAVHLEALEDMTTDALINGLRCFMAIRGPVQQIRCDQGTNFIGAKNELRAALKQLDEAKLERYLIEHQCTFKLNTPSASHAGGVWERQIRTVRSILSSLLNINSNRLDSASFRTLLYEVMSIINSRPLAVLNLNDPLSETPITPNHLLTMKSKTLLPPPGEFVKEDTYARKRWRRVQFLSEQFWSRWRNEYLLLLNERQKWKRTVRNLQVGDIVIVMENDVPRNEWRLARVTKVKESKDNLVRSAEIQVGDRSLDMNGKRVNKPSILERPVQKLALLLERDSLVGSSD